jgi:hypothetical protein
MDLMFTFPGIAGLAIDLMIFVYFSRVLPLGALSLPCVTVLTSLFYFYVMPVTSLELGNDSFFGMYLTSLEESHWVALLYVGGAGIAFIANERQLRLDPRYKTGQETPPNTVAHIWLWIAVACSICAMFALGQLNALSDEGYEFGSEITNVAFLNLGFSMSLSLTLIYLIRDNFGPKSLALTAVILYLYSIAGFRFRLLILLCAMVICFALVRGIKLRIWMVLIGSVGGIVLMNLVGMMRKYGAGLDFSLAQGKSVAEIFSSFGGEIGMVYVTQLAATKPPDELIWAEPWIVAVTRFIPSFLWPDKPTASYLSFFSSGFAARGADQAGMAAPQHVEMIYQFGWIGVPLLAFLYFSLAIRLESRIARLNREARIAGFALIPPFFGYYMQSRGYFFQMCAEAVFTFLPLFLLHIGAPRQAPALSVTSRQTTRWNKTADGMASVRTGPVDPTPTGRRRHDD